MSLKAECVRVGLVRTTRLANIRATGDAALRDRRKDARVLPARTSRSAGVPNEILVTLDSARGMPRRLRRTRSIGSRILNSRRRECFGQRRAHVR